MRRVLTTDDLLFGTHSPALSNVSASLTNASARSSRYLRAGDLVIVFWSLQAQSTASTTKSLRITVPVDPGANFSFSSVYGSGFMGSSSAVEAVYVLAVPDTKTVLLSTDSSVSSGIQEWSGSFAYLVSS